jgi:hypothetical protein
MHDLLGIWGWGCPLITMPFVARARVWNRLLDPKTLETPGVSIE